MGIPYNPQGQAIIERTHQNLKVQHQRLKSSSLSICLINFLFVLWFFGFFFFFETGFPCVALAVLELTLLTRLASNSEILLPLCPRVLGLQVCDTSAQPFFVF